MNKATDEIRTSLSEMTEQSAIVGLKKRHEKFIASLQDAKKGLYIWGTGRLGRFVYSQCEKNEITVQGFIDNNEKNLDVEKKIFSCEILQPEDMVVIASFYCVDIMEQLERLGNNNYIYYEDLALIRIGFDTYYQAFEGIYEELETNKEKYINLCDRFADDISREIYRDIINYRISLDTKYTKHALEYSLKWGGQYFDKVVMANLDDKFTFFDVGAFDGESTLDFIRSVKEYQKIYLFEPDRKIIDNTRKRIGNKEKIVYIQAGAGEKRGVAHYNAIGGGAGEVLESGTETIRMEVLDDYIDNSKAYVKMDIEGYEMQALKGMKKVIQKYKPMLAVSVYHKCGDMHKLVDMILSWNPSYKVYMRHYTSTYADTVCYFISGVE